MVDARQLVDHIRRDLKPLDDRILRHRYLEGEVRPLSLLKEDAGRPSA